MSIHLAMDSLPRSIVSTIAGLVSLSDLKNCIMSSDKWRRVFVLELWSHVHFAIDAGPESTRHEESDRERGTKSHTNETTPSRVLAISEQNIKLICLLLMRGDLVERLESIKTLSITIPLSYPGPSSRPKGSETGILKADYVSLCHWLLKRLNTKSLPNLESLQVYTHESAAGSQHHHPETAVPLLRNFLTKFPSTPIDIREASLHEKSVIPRLNYGLSFDNIRSLVVHCEDFLDCVALCGSRPLSCGVEHLELNTIAASYKAEELKEFLSESRLKRLIIHGNVWNKNGVVWFPRSVEQLEVYEQKPQGLESPNFSFDLDYSMLSHRFRMIATGLKSLRVHVHLGHIFSQISTPSLEHLSVLSNREDDWNPMALKPLSVLVQGSSRLIEIHTVRIPCFHVSQLLLCATATRVHTLVMESSSLKRPPVDPEEFAKVCETLSCIYIDMVDKHSLMKLLKQLIRSVGIESLDIYVKSPILNGSEPIAPLRDYGKEEKELRGQDYCIDKDRGYQLLDQIAFKQRYKIKSRMEQAIDILRQKLDS